MKGIKKCFAVCLALLMASAPLASLAERDRGPRRRYTPPTFVTPWGYGYWPPYYWYSYPGNFEKNSQDASKGQTADRKSMGNITWSTKYLYQVYVNNRGIDFRLYGDGTKLAFRLLFDRDDTGAIYMQMTVRGAYGELKPVFTAAALRYLENLQVREVRVVSNDGEASYTMDTLAGMATE